MLLLVAVGMLIDVVVAVLIGVMLLLLLLLLLLPRSESIFTDGGVGGSVARVLASRAMVVVCSVVLGPFAMLEEREHDLVAVHWVAIPTRCACFSWNFHPVQLVGIAQVFHSAVHGWCRCRDHTSGRRLELVAAIHQATH